MNSLDLMAYLIKTQSGRWLALLSLWVLLGGCASTSESLNGAARTNRLQATTITRENPWNSESAELLYDLLVGEFAGQRGQFEVSVESYLNAARASGQPAVAERAARIALYADDKEAAREAVELWVAIDSGAVEPRRLAGVLALRENELDRAFEHFREAVQQANDAQSELEHIVALLAKEKENPGSVEVMDRLAQLLPEQPMAWYGLAFLARHAGDFERAEQAAGEAVRLQPEWRKAHLLMARILFQQGKTERGLEVIKRLVERRPDDDNLRLSYGGLLLDAGQIGEASTQFQALTNQPNTDVEVLYKVALLYLQIPSIDQARETLLRVVEADTEHRDEAAYYLGQIAEEVGDQAQALQWFQQVDNGEFRLSAEIHTAVLLARTGDLGTARLQLHRLRQQNPKLADQLYLVEGELLRDAGKLEEALELYDQALEQIPGNIELLYARGLVAERLDRIDLLERDMRAILVEDPDNVDALNALGYTLADRTTRYQEAMELIQRALELQPDSAAIIDSMGWLQYRLGNYAEAERYLREALDRLEDAEIAAHLGEVLLAQGRTAEAREVLVRALEQDPENSILLRVWEQLER